MSHQDSPHVCFLNLPIRGQGAWGRLHHRRHTLTNGTGRRGPLETARNPASSARTKDGAVAVARGLWAPWFNRGRRCSNCSSFLASEVRSLWSLLQRYASNCREALNLRFGTQFRQTTSTLNPIQWGGHIIGFSDVAETRLSFHLMWSSLCCHHQLELKDDVRNSHFYTLLKGMIIHTSTTQY
jgi:hypothetical protein